MFIYLSVANGNDGFVLLPLETTKTTTGLPISFSQSYNETFADFSTTDVSSANDVNQVSGPTW